MVLEQKLKMDRIAAITGDPLETRANHHSECREETKAEKGESHPEYPHPHPSSGRST